MDRRAFAKSMGTAALGSLVAGCAGAGREDHGGADRSPTATRTPSPGPTVRMTGSRGGADFVFSPVGLHVAPGTTVTFRIVEGVHSSTAYHPANGDSPRVPEAAGPWNSGTFAMGSYEHAFEVEGTYDYYCIPHRPYGMVGRVVCGSPGGPAEGSMPPDGRVPESGRIASEGSVSPAEL